MPSRGAKGVQLEPRAWSCPEDAEHEARQMFQRVLATWASDVLALRARGLDRPRFIGSGLGQATPGTNRAA